MDSLSKSILATVIYCDVFNFPLTSLEIYHFLINPGRISKVIHIQGRTLYESYPQVRSNSAESLAEVVDYLDILVQNGKLGEKNGFYFLPGRQNLYHERIEKNKIAELKWKKTRRYLFWVQAIPFIEAVFTSGSLALGHTDKNSDLDVLVVAKKGRIWLARVLISLAMSLLGVRRKNKDKMAPDKICLNHYIAVDSLKIPFESLYTAQSYAHLIPLYWKNRTVVENFWKANRLWMEKFLRQWEWPWAYQKRAIQANRLLAWFRFVGENFLDRTGLADWLEKLARYLQLRRINTYLPGRVIANDWQLEFHPFSAEKEILQKYNRKISFLGIFGDYQESDSGLR